MRKMNSPGIRKVKYLPLQSRLRKPYRKIFIKMEHSMINLILALQDNESSGGFLTSPFFAYSLSAVILIIATFAIIYYKKKVQELQEHIKENEFQTRMVKSSYTQFFENSPIMYFVINPAGILISCNERVFEQLKYKRKEMIGVSLKQYFKTDPEDAFDKFLKNLIKEKTGNFRVVFRDADNVDRNGKAYCSGTINAENEITSLQMVVFLYDRENQGA